MGLVVLWGKNYLEDEPVAFKVKISKLLSILLVASIGIASIGFGTAHYICASKKTSKCDHCRNVKSEACCKLVFDYSKIATVGEIAHHPTSQQHVLPIAFPALSTAPESIISHPYRFYFLNTGPSPQASSETIVLRI